MLQLPSKQGLSGFAGNSGVIGSYVNAHVPTLSWEDDCLSNVVTCLYVSRVGGFPEDHVDRAGIPICFDKSALQFQTAGCPVYQRNEQDIRFRASPPNVGQVEFEQVLLVLTVKETEARLEHRC